MTKPLSSALSRAGLFKIDPKQQFMQILQTNRGQRVGDALDLTKDRLACLLEMLAHSVTAHQPQGDTTLMQHVHTEFDTGVIQKAAQGALLMSNIAVRNLLDLLLTQETDEDTNEVKRAVSPPV